MSSRTPTLSALETLHLGLVILYTALAAILAFLRAPFRGESGHGDVWTHVAFAANRARNRRASARQLQYMNLPTDEAYQLLARRKQFKPVNVSLPKEAKAHWIGNEEAAAKILVHIHGGGFVKPAACQLDLLWELKTAFALYGLAICVLSYSLAPGAQDPTQLEQVSDLLSYLVKNIGRKPEDIIVCGDSAGGNLVLGLLSHMLHGKSSITPVKLPGPLLGVALIGPWGEFRTTAPAYTRNAFKDTEDAYALSKWAAYYLGNAEPDPYNQPFRTSAAWWENLNSVVQNIIITAGTDEVFVDDIEAFARQIKSILPEKTVVAFGDGEVHDQPFIEPLTDDGKRCYQTRALKAWIESRLRDSRSQQSV